MPTLAKAAIPGSVLWSLLLGAAVTLVGTALAQWFSLAYQTGRQRQSEHDREIGGAVISDRDDSQDHRRDRERNETQPAMEPSGFRMRPGIERALDPAAIVRVGAPRLERT